MYSDANEHGVDLTVGALARRWPRRLHEPGRLRFEVRASQRSRRVRARAIEAFDRRLPELHRGVGRGRAAHHRRSRLRSDDAVDGPLPGAHAVARGRVPGRPARHRHTLDVRRPGRDRRASCLASSFGNCVGESFAREMGFASVSGDPRTIDRDQTRRWLGPGRATRTSRPGLRGGPCRRRTDGGLPDGRVLRGMDAEETAAMTRAFVASGTTVQLGDIGRPVVDKHSTGGVGDAVSLVFAPLVAALGLACVKSRGGGWSHRRHDRQARVDPRVPHRSRTGRDPGAGERSGA